MTPGLLMSIAAVVLVAALILVVVNFSRIAKDPGIMLESRAPMVLHMVGGILATIGGAGLLAGFTWFLVGELAGRH